jgi:hypothetical protein
MAESESPVRQAPSSLSLTHLFNHFFLLHDFFHKITKTRGNNADYFDLQIDVYNGMKAAVSTGSKASQVVAFTSLCWYFLRGNSIKLRFLYGFLFTYWYNHIMTLGSYAGVFCRMPSNSHPTQVSTGRPTDTTSCTPKSPTWSCASTKSWRKTRVWRSRAFC